MTIIDYKSSRNITVEFEDGTTREGIEYCAFKRGNVFNHNSRFKVGQIHKNNQGCKMKILEFVEDYKVIIQFDDEYKYEVKCYYTAFENGRVKNPYHPSVYGVGYVGCGKHNISVNWKATRKYYVWSHIIQRCYDTKNIAYSDCIICDEWHNYQNFGDWYDENYYEVCGERMEVDKDILSKGNRIYSPENCIFVPKNINMLFQNRKTKRGKYPIGVYFKERQSKFVAQCNNMFIKNHREFLGYHSTPELAFQAYKEYKEAHIKEVADYYKDKIPKKLYDAMYRYEVEITD